MYCLAIHPAIRGPDLMMLAAWDATSQNAVFVPKSRLFSGSHNHDEIQLSQPLLFISPVLPRSIAAKLRLRCVIIDMEEIRLAGGQLVDLLPKVGASMEEPTRKQSEFIEPIEV
jgi:hypothetical protein